MAIKKLLMTWLVMMSLASCAKTESLELADQSSNKIVFCEAFQIIKAHGMEVTNDAGEKEFVSYDTTATLKQIHIHNVTYRRLCLTQ